MREWMGNASNVDDERCLLVLPGLNYPAQLPGLYLPMRALSLEGWKVFHGQWELADLSAPERRAAVSEAAAEFVCRTAGAGRRLIMAKSLGTLAAGCAADHAIPAVWVTPLLRDDRCVRDIARSSAPALLVAGSRDWAWDDAAARRTGKRRLQLGTCDHALLTGDWREEVEMLEVLTSAVADFARDFTCVNSGV